MIEQLKLKHLQCAFLKLTEVNQFFILGFIEGLMVTQNKCDRKLIAKVSDASEAVRPVFFKSSADL